MNLNSAIPSWVHQSHLLALVARQYLMANPVHDSDSQIVSITSDGVIEIDRPNDILILVPTQSSLSRERLLAISKSKNKTVQTFSERRLFEGMNSVQELEFVVKKGNGTRREPCDAQCPALKIENIEALQALFEETARDPAFAEPTFNYKHFIERGAWGFFSETGELVGAIGKYAENELEIEIGSLFVKATHRSRGIAQSLIATCLASISRVSPHKSLYCWVSSDNQPSLSLSERYDVERIGSIVRIVIRPE